MKPVEKTDSGSPGPVTIGCAALTGQHFKGRIDELRIYNRALGLGEVAADAMTPIQTPQSNPVADYPFDENEGTTAHDASGNPNPHEGTLSGAGVKWAPGKYGTGLKFEGGEGCVTIRDATELQLGEEFTLESWVRPEGELAQAPAIFKESTEGSPSYDLGIGFNTPGKPEGQIGKAGKSHQDIAATASLEPDVWSHLALTYDGVKLRLYVNGTLATTKYVLAPIFQGSGPLTIGCAKLTGSYFKGRIDEVRIYNRALDQGEVAIDGGVAIQTPAAAPIAAYPFDENTGTVAHDSSGNLHEGTFSAEGVSWAPGKYGSALQFDGAKGCLSIPDSQALQLGEEFSLESWVRPEGGQGHYPAIYKESSEGFPSYSLGIGFNTAGKPEGQLGKQGKGHQDLAATASLEPEVWSHLALTYDGVKLRLYVNGELAATKYVEKPKPETAGPLTIGCAALGAQHFKGRIDEVRIYNRALGEAELRQSMSAPLPRAATEAATDIGPNDVIMNGWVEANGPETEYYFEYGPTTAFGETVVGEEMESEGEKLETSEAIVDLAPETKYYYRLADDSPGGTSYGKTMTLITGTRTMTTNQEKELHSAEESFTVLPSAEPPGDFYGMMWNGNLGETENDYQAIENSGAKMIRLEVNFGTGFSRTAEAFRRAQAHNLTVLPYVTGADFPKHETNESPPQETEQWKKWTTYAKEVIEKFGPNSTYGIKTWEIWNEPNMPHRIVFQKGETKEQKKETAELKEEVIEKVDPGDFGNFFGVMSKIMKATALIGENQEGIEILAPGMYGYKHSEKNKKEELHETAVKFLELMGHESAYDALSLHPYVFKVGKQHHLHKPRENMPQDYGELAKAVKRLITDVHKFDKKKPIWITELGFPVINTLNPGVFPPVSPSVQKALLQASFSMVQNNRARLNIEHALYYNIQDKPETNQERAEGEVWEAHAGLLALSGARRPAWYAYRCLAEGLAPGESEGEGKVCSS